MKDNELLELQLEVSGNAPRDHLEIKTGYDESDGEIELELDSPEEDDWNGRLYIPKLRGRKSKSNIHPTMRSWYKRPRDKHGMKEEITLDTFLMMNGDNEGRVPNRDVRPPHKTNTGGLGYLNIPTALEQIRGEEPIREVGEVIEEPSM